eukprot:SAG22_NODE_182_length_16036_cov_13.692226_7_plen_213_part_00
MSGVPGFTRVFKKFDDTCIADADIPAAVAAAMGQTGLDATLNDGDEVALTCGSRGVHQIAAIIKAAGDWVIAQGGKPFVVPSMGSHGGATAAGQAEVLHSYGVTEEFLGFPIRAGMDCIELPRMPDHPEVPVFQDKEAAKATACVVINRIKPHTQVGTMADLTQIQSGLVSSGNLGPASRSPPPPTHTHTTATATHTHNTHTHTHTHTHSAH